MRTSVTTVVLLSAATLTLAGCSSSSTSSGSSATTAGTSSSPAVTGTVTVLAAASLTEAFTTLGKQFEAAHPGTTVKLSFGGSSALALQINEGAPADVFASAATKNMTQVVTKGGAAEADVKNFASNVLEIATPPSNPQNVTGVNDLAKTSVKVAVCLPAVPCGAAAVTLFKNAGITVKPVTQEADVKATLAKVESNEVDAGVVYVTDVLAAGTKVKGVAIDPSVNVSTEYPIAPLTKASNAAGADAFVAYVLSDAGQKVLADGGFAKP
ncbi:molybdate transport system substrate-binding protein [Jatrophihabitans sp. GAS493]|uniref:molybdate ABC transporter substrate-binding protein n=1 Tax=Jatrophihabitans sp. GAS493 TaxID=1907575 RepID=UPI000BB87363|nr:molybdate ABC transporter substrate-binding protein [Jatrophihabitans sp. GAS493]SOD70757.1 molybdate transport system substrate-binding protein [Jatrophihabitans sp. GAS493]